MLEKDAQSILEYMASNGLVANTSKTAFMILNLKKEQNRENITIKIGSTEVKAEQQAKLLGVTLDNNQKWSSQIKGVGGMISSLNSRLYLLRRISRVMNQDRIKKVADSLYTSKIRYGLQLIGKVRVNESDPVDTLLECLQLTQNKFARFLHGSTLLDRINTKVIFNETKILSVNQINAQTKLLEVWKSQHDEAYPLKWASREETIKRIGLKSSNKPELIIEGQSKLQTQCFINDAARIWNLAPMTIKECNSISAAKKYIKTFVKTLPI